MNLGHLVRRFVTSLSPTPPAESDVEWAHSWLGEGEIVLWDAMPVADRRHSIDVARRFQRRRPDASGAEMAGALLHDAGKAASGLGTFGRVVATVVGPRTERFRQYREHEAIGAELVAAAGSDPITVSLIRGEGPAAADLRAADDSI